MAMGYAPIRIGNVRQLTDALAQGERWDAVFNFCEGLRGFAREAQVPALLEAYLALEKQLPRRREDYEQLFDELNRALELALEDLSPQVTSSAGSAGRAN